MSIIERIQALPPEERREVSAEILRIDERRRLWEDQQAQLRRMQERHAGRGMLKRLLENRAEERRRG
jgi:hypothetical protein